MLLLTIFKIYLHLLVQAVVDRYNTVEVTGFTPGGKPLNFQVSAHAPLRLLRHWMPEQAG